MLLISIHPFVFRKIFVLAAALLGFSSVLCFADSLFMAKQYGFSQDRGRGIVHAAARLHGSTEARPAPGVGRFVCENAQLLPTVPFVDATSVEIGFEMDQSLATRVLPLSQTPAWDGSEAGLTLTLPTQAGTEFGSF